MRTNIVIDDTLIAEAMAVTGASSKKAAVELGLKALIKQQAMAELKGLRGKVKWTGDLDAMRRD
jgi:Arc/MetJ family transcription regulator